MPRAAYFIWPIVTLNLGAAVSYASTGRLKLAGYWFMVAACNAIMATL